MNIIKETLIFVFEMLKFFFISVPLACCVYFTAHLYFEIKRLYHGKKQLKTCYVKQCSRCLRMTPCLI